MSSDKSLIKSIRDSDPAAFKTLYYRYFDRLYDFIYARTDSSELARDFVQDIFASLWKNRHKLEIQSSVKAYLYRAAQNMIVSFFRKRSHERDYTAEQTAEQNKPLDNSLETQTNIQMALDRLPEKLQAPFILSRFEGLKYAEIANVFDISIKTVESRISEALKLLRDELL